MFLLSEKVIIKNKKYGTFYYNEKGEYHREDGPAIEYFNRDKQWWQNGKRHRVDGPAIEWSNGDKKWYQNDKLHRLDGPAIEYSDGSKIWYYQDEYINCSSQEEFERIIKLKCLW